ncbi:putative beta-carotene-binding protein [Neodiprion virginianus]|uniref:putative beta-carotene-binding protein n=1 Tax=Neodiprion virginianus TaxID=2961670 RepID=UPI001EE704B9|nr:putative beta-carotene-binding protein [Neodiprion virginianus]
MSENNLSPLLIAVFALFVSVNATIPDYIHTCKRTDPKIEECVINSLKNLRPQLTKGIPEFEMPSIDPLKMPHINLNLGPGFKAEGEDLLISGAKDFEIQNLVVNLKEDIIIIDLFIKKLIARGIYEIDGKIASIPLKGTGPLFLSGDTVTVHVVLHGKKVNKNGQLRYYFPSMDLKLNIVDYDLKLEGIGGGDPTLGKVTNQVLKDEKASIKQTLVPAIEKSLSEYLLNAANNICKHFTYDELFPAS